MEIGSYEVGERAPNDAYSGKIRGTSYHGIGASEVHTVTLSIKMLRQRACQSGFPAPGIASNSYRNVQHGRRIVPSSRQHTRNLATCRSGNGPSVQQARSIHSSPNSRRKLIHESPFPLSQSLQKLRTTHLLQFVRNVSGKPLPQRRSWFLNFFYRTSAWIGATVGTIGAGIVIFFLYDASTYREDLSYKEINISDLALRPRRGGMFFLREPLRSFGGNQISHVANQH